MKSSTIKVDIYEKVTEAIINQLNAGIIPWQKPWVLSEMPMNMISKKGYRGINTWYLMAQAELRGYKSNFWLTFKQAKDLGGNIKKGEKGSLVVFWKINKYSQTNAAGESKDKTIPFLRYSTVFNLEQTEGIEIPAKVVNEIGSVEKLENVFEKWIDKPSLSFGGDSAFYSPASDSVQMPNKDQFKNTASFYSVLSHEYGHSTGARKRLNREGVSGLIYNGSEQYAEEELVAEMFASYMLAIAGIEQETQKNNVAYIQSWIKKLKNDSKMLVKAAGKAQKAVDYVLDSGKEVEKEEETEMETAI
jgi:antirestriction protein ArdC